MEQARIVFTQMLALFGMVLVGYCAIRWKLLPESAKEVLPDYVTKIAMPAAILSNLLSVDRALLASSGIIVGAAAVGLVVSWLLGRGSARLFGLAPDTANAHTLSNMYSNTTFLGIPLMTALYPQGIFCIPIYSLTCNVVLYTVSTGLYMKDSGKKKAGAGEVLRRLANPVTLATLFGIFLVLAGLTLPSIAVDIVGRLGDTSSAVSMLYIGTVLTDMDLSVVWKRVSILATVPVRMVAMPLAAFFLLRALNAGELITAVLTVMFALPCQVSISMLVKTGGSDYMYVTEYVLLSTLLSIITIPIVTTLMAVL